MATWLARGRTSVVGRLLRKFWKHSRTGAGLAVWAGIFIVLAILALAIFAPWIAPFDPNTKISDPETAAGSRATLAQARSAQSYSTASWVNASEVQSLDGITARSNASGDILNLSDFRIAVLYPDVSALDVGVDYYGSANNTLAVALSWDGGRNWTPDQLVPVRTAWSRDPVYLSFTGDHAWNGTVVNGTGLVVRVTHVLGNSTTVGPVFLDQIQVRARFLGPVLVMGSDRAGFDVLSRIIWGARVPLAIVGVSTLLSLSIGLPLGLLSGYKGGRLDRLLVLIMDSVYAFPGLLLAITIAAIIGPGILNISVAIAVVYAPTYFRVIRNHVNSVKQQTYVEAATALGVPRGGIIARYILPNVSQNIPVIFSINAADAILTEAGLTFLGLGLPPGIPDWGLDISLNWQRFDVSWWATFYPGLFILILATALTFVGEGLNDILNPLLRKRAAPVAGGA